MQFAGEDREFTVSPAVKLFRRHGPALGVGVVDLEEVVEVAEVFGKLVIEQDEFQRAVAFNQVEHLFFVGHAAEEDAAQVVAALLQQRVDHFRRGRGFREDHDDARPGRLRSDAGVNLHFERAALELLRLAVEQKQADLTLRFSRSGGDESAARSVPLQHSGADEAVDRLVDGHVSDPVLLAEVALGGQFFAGPVDARQDLLVQEAAELLVFRGIAHRFSLGKKGSFLV